MSITLIAAIAKNGVIGAKNDLPWYIPEDLKHFKELTVGKTVLMGRKTFESILKRLGKPLPNRTNVVVTRQSLALDPKLSLEGVEVLHSIDDALTAHRGEEIMVIGGGEIFRQTIDRADRLEITEVDREVEGDVHFPTIDPSKWREVARDKHEGFAFVTYAR